MVHPRPKSWKGLHPYQVFINFIFIRFFFSLLEPTKPFLLLQNSHPFCFVSRLTGTPILALSLRQQNAQRLGTAPAHCISVVLWLWIAGLILSCLKESRSVSRDQLTILGSHWWNAHCVVLRRSSRHSAPHTVLRFSQIQTVSWQYCQLKLRTRLWRNWAVCTCCGEV